MENYKYLIVVLLFVVLLVFWLRLSLKTDSKHSAQLKLLTKISEEATTKPELVNIAVRLRRLLDENLSIINLKEAFRLTDYLVEKGGRL